MKEIKIFKSEEGKTQIINYYDFLLQRWPVPCEYLNIKTRYGNTFVIASGDKDKEPVILLHGSSTNSAMWMGDVIKLSKDYRVYAVDIIGEPGKSDESRPELQPENYSNWIMDILTELKIDKVNIIGNSLGGWMALSFSTINPDKVKSLVLIATSGIASAKKSFLFKVILLSLFGKMGMDKINGIVYGKLVMPKEVLEFGNLVFKNYNPRMDGLYVFNDNELKNLTMPVYLLVGDKDPLLPSIKTANRLDKLLNKDKLKIKIIKDRGHVIVDSIDDIIRFLNKGYV